MRTFLLFFMMAAFTYSCSNSSGTDSETTETETSAPHESVGAKYKLTAFSESPEYPDAKIGQMSYLDTVWRFQVSGDSYKLGEQTSDAGQKMCANSAKGQHIHLIIENQPYNARYTSEFNDVILGDGQYRVLAFLSRSYHESIKTQAAHTAQTMTIEGGSMKASESIVDPMIFYSRPKGTYVGEAETKKVMLDFYVINATIGGNYQVKVNINNEEIHILDKWQPYYIEGLPMGINTIELTLLDKNGNTAEALLNPVKRQFELKADQLEQ